MKYDSGARSTRRSITLGMALWGLLLCAIAVGKAPMGVIELLFLFAPLVIVPLGIVLAEHVSGVDSGWLPQTVRALQPFAAISVLASFWLPPGRLAALLAAPWAAICLMTACGGLVAYLGRSLRSMPAFAGLVARTDLGIAGAWLLASRLGFGPLGIQEPIILLTALHFHYTGFATALIAGAMAEFAGRTGRRSFASAVIAMLVLLLPYVIAMGFVFSPALKVAGAILLSASMVGLALCQLSISRQFRSQSARILLAVSSISVIAGMSLAAVYATGEFLGKDWLPIPFMATTHGLMNAVGFVLPAVLGWLLAYHSSEGEVRPTLRSSPSHKAAAVWFSQADCCDELHLLPAE